MTFGKRGGQNDSSDVVGASVACDLLRWGSGLVAGGCDAPLAGRRRGRCFSIEIPDVDLEVGGRIS